MTKKNSLLGSALQAGQEILAGIGPGTEGSGGEKGLNDPIF